jgi:hypothetical protein
MDTIDIDNIFIWAVSALRTEIWMHILIEASIKDFRRYIRWIDPWRSRYLDDVFEFDAEKLFEVKRCGFVYNEKIEPKYNQIQVLKHAINKEIDYVTNPILRNMSDEFFKENCIEILDLLLYCDQSQAFKDLLVKRRKIALDHINEIVIMLIKHDVLPSEYRFFDNEELEDLDLSTLDLNGCYVHSTSCFRDLADCVPTSAFIGNDFVLPRRILNATSLNKFDNNNHIVVILKTILRDNINTFYQKMLLEYDGKMPKNIESVLTRLTST